MLIKAAALMMVAATLATPKFNHRQVGGDIYSLQSRLFDLGYYDKKITGMFGSLTETSYKKFQQLNGFTENGVVSDAELTHLYSTSVKPKLDSRRVIQKIDGLSFDTFVEIDKKVTQSISIQFVTKGNKAATFTVKSSQGHLIGSLDGIKAEDLTLHLRYPIVATIQNTDYPASLDYNGKTAQLHFKDSWTFLNLPDTEHQNNINRLLGF